MNNTGEELLIGGAPERSVVLDPTKVDATDDVAAETDVVSPAPTAGKYRWFILEPGIMMLFFALNLSAAVFQNQVLYQTCRVVFHFNESDCAPLLGVKHETPASEAIENIVQPYVAKILMSRSLMESIIPAFISLFIGPWSDKFGRRPILLMTFLGYFLAMSTITILALIAQQVPLNPWIFNVVSLPSMISGGTCALITGIYCYISDVAPPKTRALRMMLNEGSILIGLTAGSISSSYIYAATNAFVIFLISSIVAFLGFLYIYFFVPESLSADQISSESRVREFFKWKLAADLFKTCFKRRQNYDRAVIWLIMLTLTITILVMEGDNTVSYLFVRKRFEWTLEDYTLFNAFRIVVQVVGSAMGMYVFRNLMGCSIVVMALLAIGCSVLESVVRATAIYAWHMYLGTVLGFMRGITGPMCRAIMSHITPTGDLGKVFALTTSLESISPLAAAPLYTTVYTATLTYNPGAFNFISAGLFFICFSFLSTVFGIQKAQGNMLYQEN